MTHKRSWLALGALAAAIIGGTVWAAEQEKKPTDAATHALVPPQPNGLEWCIEQCPTKEKEKTCCEGKCSVKEKDKGCCADGKCCGCCDKAKQTFTLPIALGSSYELLISPPPGVAAPAPVCLPAPPACAPSPYVDGSYPSSWGGISSPQMPPPAPAMQYTPVTQYIATPANVQPPLPAPCQVMPCPRAAGSPWRIRAVAQKDHTSLEMQLSGGGEDACAYCDSMVVKIGTESLKVSVADKQVHVHGSFVKGSADSVTRNTADGSVLFEGHVKLTYEKAGQKAEVSAERVVVGVADGRLEVKPVEPNAAAVLSFGFGFFH